MRKQKKQPELGDRVKHVFIVQLTGIVTAVTHYLNGCRRCAVQATRMKDGKPIEADWYDETELLVVKQGTVKIGPQDNGGPRPDPKPL